MVNKSSLKNLIRGFKKGNIPWNKGLKGLQPWQNISGLLNISGKERGERGFKKGMTPFNKGKEYLQIRGEKHWKWKRNRDELIRKDQRSDSLYKRWMNEVKRRDKECKMKDENCYGYLIAHHIRSWENYPGLRYKVSNGKAVCQFHHYEIHGFNKEKLIKNSSY